MNVETGRLRVAMFNYNLPAPGRKRGGVDHAAHTLAHGLGRRGHDVVVFTHDDRPDGAAYAVSPLPWKRFVDSWLGRRLTMGYLGNLLAVLPDYGDFDVVIMHGDSLLSRWCGRPVVRVMHGSGLGEARTATSIGRRILQSGVYGLELLTALCYRHVVAVSANTVRDNPFVRLLIPHGVDDSIFRPGPGARSTEPSVLFVGTLDGRKRGRFLVDGFTDTIRKALPEATLTVVGPSGPPIPGVEYRTGVHERELAELYRRAWVYASPSAYEGFGLPYLEAMACGTAVVATPNPGSREVLGDGKFGLTPKDTDFASTVASLLRDERQRTALASAGLARAREYSLSRMLNRYETLLFEVVGFADAGTAAA